MNVVDIIIICIIALGALKGFLRGFFKESLVVIGTILVIVFAFILKNPLSSIMYNNLPFLKLGGLSSLNIIFYEIVAFVIAILVLAFILAVVVKVSTAISNALKSTKVLEGPSKLLGLALGVVHSLVICFALLFILSLPAFGIKLVEESKFSNFILNNIPILSDYNKNIINSFEDIREFKNNFDLKDKEKTNLGILRILLDNKIVTEDSVKLLIEKNKLSINYEDIYKDDNINEIIDDIEED